MLNDMCRIMYISYIDLDVTKVKEDFKFRTKKQFDFFYIIWYIRKNTSKKITRAYPPSKTEKNKSRESGLIRWQDRRVYIDIALLRVHSEFTQDNVLTYLYKYGLFWFLTIITSHRWGFSYCFFHRHHLSRSKYLYAINILHSIVLPSD